MTNPLISASVRALSYMLGTELVEAAMPADQLSRSFFQKQQDKLDEIIGKLPEGPKQDRAIQQLVQQASEQWKQLVQGKTVEFENHTGTSRVQATVLDTAVKYKPDPTYQQLTFFVGVPLEVVKRQTSRPYAYTDRSPAAGGKMLAFVDAAFAQLSVVS